MGADGNGWNDVPEDEREQLGEWEAESEEWRGDLHTGDWPEHLAGPEYWLYKKLRDE